MSSAAQRAAALLQRHWWRPRPSGLALALSPLSSLYGVLSGLHRVLATRQAPPALPRPVLVVGNLIAGGAGKTPTTIALVQWLATQGWRAGIVSRGYGREDDELQFVHAGMPASQCGDEPLLMHLRTRAPVAVARDRAAAAQALVARHPELDLIVADDGLQHWRLHRDLQLIVFDGRGAGNGLLLPAGPLRQRLPTQLPPATWLLYNASHPSTALPGPCAPRGLGGAVALADWWRGEPGSAETLARLQGTLAGRLPLAAAGIAEPERFFGMLREAGLPHRALALPDHASLDPLPWPADEPEVLITEKDAVKLLPAMAGSGRVWVITLDFELPAALTDALRPAVATLIAASPHHDR